MRQVWAAKIVTKTHLHNETCLWLHRWSLSSSTCAILTIFLIIVISIILLHDTGTTVSQDPAGLSYMSFTTPGDS